ncbi:hypothetical protein [Mycobacterium sp. 48b]
MSFLAMVTALDRWPGEADPTIYVGVEPRSGETARATSSMMQAPVFGT